jgi:hypothetical protein
MVPKAYSVSSFCPNPKFNDMKVFFSILLGLLLQAGLLAQVKPDAYKILIGKARDAQRANLPRKSLKFYEEAFLINKGQVKDLLKAAEIFVSIKKLEDAEELFLYLFDNYPLETAITFFEDPNFESNRDNRFFEVFLHRAAYGLGPHKNGRVELDRFDTAPYRYAMPNDSYILLTEIASRSLKIRDYQRAVYYYDLAFAMKRKSTLSLLRAAVAALHLQKFDAADAYIKDAFGELPFFTLKMVRLMPDFKEALNDPQFVGLVGREIGRHFPDMDLQLVGEIDRLHELFMKYRRTPSEAVDSSGVSSYQLLLPDPETRAKQDALDRIISAKMDSLLRTSGYPSLALVADRLVEFDRLFYAVLPEVILENWESILSGGINAGGGLSFFQSPSSLANRYDYVCYKLGIKQWFGSILAVPESLRDKGLNVWPIENPLEVNERRLELGLEPLKKYLRKFRKKVNLKAQSKLGELPENSRDQVHAKPYRQKELSGYPYNYQ